MSKRRRNHHPRNNPNRPPNQQNQLHLNTKPEDEAVFPRLDKNQTPPDKVVRDVNDPMAATTWGFLSRKPSGQNPQKKFNPDGINDKKVKIISSIGGDKEEMHGSIIDEIQEDLNMELPSLNDIGGELSMNELQLNSMDFRDLLDSETDDSILEGILSDDDD